MAWKHTQGELEQALQSHPSKNRLLLMKKFSNMEISPPTEKLIFQHIIKARKNSDEQAELLAGKILEMLKNQKEVEEEKISKEVARIYQEHGLA